MTNVKIIERQIAPIVEDALSIYISDDSRLKEAVILLSELNKYNDNITEEKEKVTKPLNEALKAERARWKPLETLYTSAMEALRQKMTTYQTEQVEAKRETTERLTNKAISGYMKSETVISRLEALPEVEKEVATDSGLVQFAEVKRFEVLDLALVPIDYHLPNEVMIRKAMKENIELPGVRYYTEQQPRNYR